MIKKCKHCKKEFTARRPNQDYCSPKCRKAQEVLLRRVTTKSPWKTSKPGNITSNITKPDTLNPVASACWDYAAPILIERGHLNVLSEDIFAELCDLYSKLKSINKILHDERAPAKVDTLGGQGYMKFWLSTSTKRDIPPQSPFSNLKRKYLKLFLLYCKEFYLTSLSVEGRD